MAKNLKRATKSRTRARRLTKIIGARKIFPDPAAQAHRRLRGC
jgi:hypothetical protein